MPYQVQADRTRLKQVLINLLSNAIKYNKPGGAVLVTCVPGTPGRIRISVADTGAGLSRDEISQLFQPFNRLGQAGSAQAGTGIGLVVAKQLAELMDGSIGVQSTVGQGSVFSIDIGLTERLALVAIAQAPLRTVLYVEDNPAYQMLVADLLARRLDLRLLSAKDGNTGINIARACLPDVILMDINLPGMSGTEALMILAKDPATAHIPVLAISANAMPRDIEKGLQAGFFRYISKPVKIDELLDALDDALTFSQKTSGASAQAAQA